jgi:lipopolysaccharide transport system permease protein
MEFEVHAMALQSQGESTPEPSPDSMPAPRWASAAARAESRRRAARDLAHALQAWPIVLLIGSTDVEARYRRSALGQLWITLSLAITVFSIGLVWAYIWKQPTREFLPYFAIGQIIWVYMTGVLSDATTIYVEHSGYLREVNLPRSTYLLSNIVKHTIILGHNALLLPPLFLIFGLAPSPHIVLIVPAFLVSVVFLGACSTVLAIGGLRFRDVPSIVASVIGILYFLTPVIWQPDALPQEFISYLPINPLAIFLELFRAPILGHAPPPHYWWIAIGLTVAMLLVAMRLFTTYRARLTFWL